MVKAFEIAGYGETEVVERFGGMYRAFQYGAPPHGGMAAGVDRIVMLLCGTTNLRGVYKYAEPINAKGFVFMDSPGYDPVSATGQVASGGNIICFTTGRGSVFGCKPVPSIKLATNTAMYQRMSEDMDVDCGEILSRGVPMQEMGQRIFDLILRVASGEKSKSEELGFGDNEFTPWQIGATM